jgi:hypothetical protein
MGYGIEVFNSSGVLQFTSDVACIKFDRKITVSTGAFVAGGIGHSDTAGDWSNGWSYGSGSSRINIWSAPISITSDEIIVVKSSFPVSRLVAWADDGWMSDYKTVICNVTGSNTGVPPAAMDLYIFKNATWGAGTTFECYNSAGTRTFSDANKTLRVPYVFSTANLTATAPTVLPGTETFNVASGNWGVMASVLRTAGAYYAPTGQSDAVADGFYSDSTHVYVKPTVYLGFDYGGYNNYYPWPGNAASNSTQVFAVDLTGL